MLDLIVDRREMKALLARALRFMGAQPAPVPPSLAVAGAVDGEPPR